MLTSCKNDIETEENITNIIKEEAVGKTKNYIPKGIQTLVPLLNLKNVPVFIDFVKNQMGATIVAETKSDAFVTYYATIRFDNTTIFVNEVNENLPETTGSLYLYVPDTDAFYKKLIEAGAISISEPETYYHGDRFATIKDQWNNVWFIATAQEDLTQDEVQDRRKNDER